ncbi:hypothetical protein EEL32_12305 [Brevibacillus laterosporus]|uniref:Uncharacterized protein n=1 Tax=Brevibacillus laterosporus TaxID=1465 RepID=A0A502HEG7_BRELA|nr:hypothetical protein [Brevibacillus laterosporus]QDX93183.1 hypothetical protein EEL30_13235 [Brevibacillus laterosporus]TPG72921.1 hypothetical protein EEL31_00570 [Brevibacillus laterosporus]TPG86879.1 hypothetical protein EEL32_12305 [Brevibacillus laterosporus]
MSREIDAKVAECLGNEREKMIPSECSILDGIGLIDFIRLRVSELGSLGAFFFSIVRVSL